MSSQVIFYCESSILGGHEKMAIAAHQALLEFGKKGYNISWLVNKRNHQLLEALSAAFLPYTAIESDHPVDVRNPSLGSIRQVLSLMRTFRELNPRLVVVLQGGIVSSYAGILAARLSGTNFCSYIPMAPRSTELSTYRFPKIWNHLRSTYFKLIPKYITIDEIQAKNILREHNHAKIRIVENCIRLSSAPKVSKKGARSHLDLSEGELIIGVLGRIEFGQKAQDWVVTELGRDLFLSDKVLLIVGDGPDMLQLQKLISTLPNARKIQLLGWRDNLDQIYAAIDLVLIPSRSEGVPLVMLEALSRRIPVVGTDRDGMASWLPKEWRFPFGNAFQMKCAIDRASSDQSMDWSQIEARLSRVTNKQRFAAEFEAAFDEYIS